jgi:hypothetical protein
MKYLTALLLATSVAGTAVAQDRPRDEYARYELLPPSTGSFRVISEITVSSGGAASHAVPIARGVEATDVAATDLMTGAPLAVRQTSAAIRVELARPVATGAEARVRVARTEKDASTYRRTGEAFVFTRTVTAKRGSVVLPAGFEITGANIPVQIVEMADGRIAAAFMNPFPVDTPLTIQGRAIKPRPASTSSASAEAAPAPPAPDPAPREQPMNQIRVTERALQDREIVYFLKEPETHAFSLYHDYTAARDGERQYVNVVRTGSAVSDPSAKVLDTGETLQTRTLTGADIAREKIDIPDRVDPDTQVVLIPFPPVKQGTSLRLRISETYTDPARYAVVDGQLMWHRSFGRPRNDMVLPPGWYLTTSSMPAVISLEPDGRTRLSFWNPRPDSLDVLVRGRRR